MIRGFRTVLSLGLMLAACLPIRVWSQSRSDNATRRGPATVVAYNALFGGATAATHALVARRNPVRAFAYGVLGGAVHAGGKYVATGRGADHGLSGMVLSATGTAIVANAGRGLGPLDELHVPLGPLRVRTTLAGAKRLRLSVNLFEAAILAGSLSREGMSLDWQQSAAHGAFVFETRGRHIVVRNGRDSVAGIATGPVVVLSEYREQRRAVLQHEVVHVHQYWFLQETWGRPIEMSLRRALPGVRRIPEWIELGLVTPALHALESSMFDERYGPFRRAGEAEAEWFEDR